MSSKCGPPTVVDFHLNAVKAQSDYDCPEGEICLNGNCYPTGTYVYGTGTTQVIPLQPYYLGTGGKWSPMGQCGFTSAPLNIKPKMTIDVQGVMPSDEVVTRDIDYEKTLDSLKTELAIEMLAGTEVNTDERPGLFFSYCIAGKAAGIISPYKLTYNQNSWDKNMTITIGNIFGGTQIIITREQY